MDYYTVKRICKTKLKLAERNDIRYGYNRVRRHSQYETTLHFIAKAIISKIIMDKGDGVITEAQFSNGRVPDVLHLTKKENCIIYEIESNGTNNKSYIDGTDEMVIPLNKLSPTIISGLKELEDWLREFVV